jgi:hypothetical protein
MQPEKALQLQDAAVPVKFVVAEPRSRVRQPVPPPEEIPRAGGHVDVHEAKVLLRRTVGKVVRPPAQELVELGLDRIPRLHTPAPQDLAHPLTDPFHRPLRGSGSQVPPPCPPVHQRAQLVSQKAEGLLPRVAIRDAVMNSFDCGYLWGHGAGEPHAGSVRIEVPLLQQLVDEVRSRRAQRLAQVGAPFVALEHRSHPLGRQAQEKIDVDEQRGDLR